ncbi:MAG: hypothetical protein ACYTG0_06815 [Planctomycetota bacterium]
MKKLVRCRNDYDRSRLMRESPAHYFAFELYCDSESGLRAVVEARLLAGETFSSIGARLGLTGSVIETYAQCYFDVQTRLGHVDFIHNHVLNQNSKSNKACTERDLALKRIGYCAGSKALDRVLRTRGNPASAATADSPIRGLANHVEDLLFDKVVTAIGRMKETDEKAVRTLTQVYAQLEAVRQKSSDSSSAPEDYIRNVEAMMNEVPWKLASNEVPKEFEPWRKYATDLRADEMMRIAAGQDGPAHKQMSLQLLPAGADPRPAPKT